jgi:hypothetical protein
MSSPDKTPENPQLIALKDSINQVDALSDRLAEAKMIIATNGRTIYPDLLSEVGPESLLNEALGIAKVRRQAVAEKRAEVEELEETLTVYHSEKDLWDEVLAAAEEEIYNEGELARLTRDFRTRIMHLPEEEAPQPEENQFLQPATEPEDTSGQGSERRWGLKWPNFRRGQSSTPSPRSNNVETYIAIGRPVAEALQTEVRAPVAEAVVAEVVEAPPVEDESMEYIERRRAEVAQEYADAQAAATLVEPEPKPEVTADKVVDTEATRTPAEPRRWNWEGFRTAGPRFTRVTDEVPTPEKDEPVEAPVDEGMAYIEAHGSELAQAYITTSLQTSEGEVITDGSAADGAEASPAGEQDEFGEIVALDFKGEIEALNAEGGQPISIDPELVRVVADRNRTGASDQDLIQATTEAGLFEPDTEPYVSKKAVDRALIVLTSILSRREDLGVTLNSTEDTHSYLRIGENPEPIKTDSPEKTPGADDAETPVDLMEDLPFEGLSEQAQMALRLIREKTLEGSEIRAIRLDYFKVAYAERIAADPHFIQNSVAGPIARTFEELRAYFGQGDKGFDLDEQPYTPPNFTMGKKPLGLRIVRKPGSQPQEIQKEATSGVDIPAPITAIPSFGTGEEPQGEKS